MLCQNGMRMAKKEKKKKKLVPNSVHTRPGQENSEKNSKKIEKSKQPLSCIIQPKRNKIGREREKKKIHSRIPFILDPGNEIPKKIAKKLRKLKNLILALFLSKMG